MSCEFSQVTMTSASQFEHATSKYSDISYRHHSINAGA